MIVQDPGPGFFFSSRFPDPRVKKASAPDSGSATLVFLEEIIYEAKAKITV
jgi:hypothetical protein